MPKTIKRLNLALRQEDIIMLDFLKDKFKAELPILCRYAIFHLFCHEKYAADPTFCAMINDLLKDLK